MSASRSAAHALSDLRLSGQGKGGASAGAPGRPSADSPLAGPWFAGGDLRPDQGKTTVNVMGRIIWLASFPKSGNTWMRAFLHNLMRNPSEAYDINRLGEFSFSDSTAH